jgi:mono/diheme cytochrome c family protein
MRRWMCAGVALFGLAATLLDHRPATESVAQAAPPGENGAEQYEKQVRPFLTRHCQECHGEKGSKKATKALRLDRLTLDWANAANREQWQAVLAQVKGGEMPPPKQPRPAQQEIQALESWVNARLAAAAALHATQGRVVLRRLNRNEYQNTMRDLLGVEVDLKELLPEDGSGSGFDNNAEALHISSFLMERYLEAADKALSLAIANRPKPNVVKRRMTLRDERVTQTGKSVYRNVDDGVAIFSSWESANIVVTMWQFQTRDRGRYRYRISGYGLQSPNKPVMFHVLAGVLEGVTDNHLVDYFEFEPDKPTVVEFVDHLEVGNRIRIIADGLPVTPPTVERAGVQNYKGPGLVVQWVEVEGPLLDSWPPPGHRRLFGNLSQAPVNGNRNQLEVVSQNPVADAERVLRDFARRAFRRAVTDDDIRPYLARVKAKLAEKYSFEQAVRVGLKAMLVSPEFLFLREKPGQLDDSALASRLSYFLWSTMPDDELLTLAEQKKLGKPEELRRQVERMLKDPKAAAFTENFVGQWLSLRDIDNTEPDPRLYPEFDQVLKLSMVKETRLFFDAVLKNDLSVTNFVASDFAMLNGRLARHYGIPGVSGLALRKVPVPPKSHRGGVLTMGSVMKVTANGTNTSPVLRGAWVLDRILGTPPPKPTEDIEAVEPDIRGATTIREQLAKHRKRDECARCHAKIDPPGFALESFDVIGGWRDNYRSVGAGIPVTKDGRRMGYLNGPKVDPGDVLPDGQRFRNIDDFKQILLKDKDQLARAMAGKLLTYATGRALEAADRPEIDALVARTRGKDHGLRTVIHEVVQSKLFQQK